MGLLGDLRVLDLSWHGPGSIAAWILVELGADVVKVEPPDGSDFVRSFGDRVDGTTVAHLAIDRGKRSLALDLRRDGAAEVLLAVAAGCDAVLDGFRPGVADRLGIGAAAMRARNPRLTYCQVSGFGTGGPLERRAAHDLNYVAEAGLLSLLPAGTVRTPPPAQIADYVGAAMAATAVLAGVLGARSSTAGTTLETSLFDSAAFTTLLATSQQLMNGSSPGPEGHLLAGSLACYGVYGCADGGLLTVAALEPQFWEAFCGVVGMGEVARRDQFDPRRQEDLRREVGDRLAARPLADWLERFGGVEACVAPIRTLAEAARHPQMTGRDRLAEVEHPTSGATLPAPGPPIVLHGAAVPRRRPPRLGEHTAQVLKHAGIAQAVVDALVADGTAFVVS